ncbi:MAG: bifunctional anthranilate synthase component I family protein/class IV aminotransferase [Coriobacteriia bacterium]
MLPVDGRVIAPPSVGPEWWASAIPCDAMPLVLAPASDGGWFGGLQVVVWSPESFAQGVSRQRAADVLERCALARTPCLAAALLPYDGTATVAHYTGGLVRTPEGWRVWGALNDSDVPALTSPAPISARPETALVTDVRSDLDAAAFRRGVLDTIAAIRAGDVYVLNLTRRLSGRALSRPSDAFATMISRSEADMAAFWATSGLTIVSASPERFIRIAGGCIEVCPIKGTRPRAEGERDIAMATDLLASEKERAEHVMIVDLERNDIGKVCCPGTVTVNPLFDVVATPYCHQMVSRVGGILGADASLGEVLESTFPCGSVTGAPKIAAMRKIAALEGSPRATYTGSLVVAIPGKLDSAVLIRTAEYRGTEVQWGTGGGITVDSDPAEEWLETILKASPLLGDGLPRVALRETCRAVDGQVPLLARHLARLAAGGCGPSALMRVRTAVGAAACRSAHRTRLSVTVEPSGKVEAHTSVQASSLEMHGRPVLALVRSPTPLLPSGAAKPAARKLWDRALQEATERGADHAVLVDGRGRLIDGAAASVWIRIGKHLFTPPAPPAVDGIARGLVFDYARECGFEAVVSEITVEQLADADEVFLTNALAGVVPVRGRGGPGSTALRECFERLTRARSGECQL